MNDDINMIPSHDASSSACVSSNKWFCCDRRCKRPQLSVQEDKNRSEEQIQIQKIQNGINKVNKIYNNKRLRTLSCSSTRMMCKRKKLSKSTSNYKMNKRGQDTRVAGSCCAVLDVAALLVYDLLPAAAAVPLVIMLVWDISGRGSNSRGFFVAATSSAGQFATCGDIVISAATLYEQELARRMQETGAQNPGEGRRLMGLQQTMAAARSKALSASTPTDMLDFVLIVIPPYCGNYIPRYTKESQELDARTFAYRKVFNQKSQAEQREFLLVTPRPVEIDQQAGQAGVAAAVPKAASQCCLPSQSGTTAPGPSRDILAQKAHQLHASRELQSAGAAQPARFRGTRRAASAGAKNGDGSSSCSCDEESLSCCE
ncbi:unnamed protein product [Amoebophrya sp. A25]|nr:unnamed protein product [Amoebophrya sp. A25]|eukprot:GSA25T00012042001.1